MYSATYMETLNMSNTAETPQIFYLIKHRLLEIKLHLYNDAFVNVHTVGLYILMEYVLTP